MKCDHTCIECDKHETGSWMTSCAERLIDAELCFNCEFWSDYVARRHDSAVVRVGGKHYYIGPENSAPNSCKGYGGTKWVIKFHDGRDVISTNLWHQGVIPDRFSARLPDNAEFVK